MKFIAKLFPEITIKSRPVRRRLIQRLQTNLQILLQRVDERVKVSGQWDKVEVSFPGQDAELSARLVDEMQRVPGIQSIIEVQEYPLQDFEQVFQLTREAYAERLRGKTFKVRVRRSGEHDFTSVRSEEHTSELQSRPHLVCRLLLE